MKTGNLMLCFVLMTAILSSACEYKEYIQVREYPRIDMNQNIVQDESGIRFEAIIISRAGEIEDKGFVWDEGTGASMANGSIISLGSGYGSGSFSAKIDYGVEKGLSYEVVAYLVSEGRTIYSKRMNFVSTIDGNK